jgi:hypothetical protein
VVLDDDDDDGAGDGEAPVGVGDLESRRGRRRPMSGS